MYVLPNGAITMEQLIAAVKGGTMTAQAGLDEVWRQCEIASQRGEKLDKFVKATDTIMGLDEPKVDKEAEEFYYKNDFWDR